MTTKLAALTMLPLALLLAGCARPKPPAAIVLPKAAEGQAAMLRSLQQLGPAFPPEDCVALIEHADAALDLQGWRAGSATIYAYWEDLRRRQPSPTLVARLNRLLLARFARGGMLFEGECLIRAANAKASDSGDLDLALSRIAAESRPAGAYRGSLLSVLVAAAFRCRDFARAQSYLHAVAASEVESLTDLCAQATRGSFDIPGAIRAWESRKDDPLDCAALRPELVHVGLLCLRSNIAAVDDLLARTVTEPGADEYWRSVIRQAAAAVSPDLQDEMALLDRLCRAYEIRYSHPDCAAETWLNIALRERTRHPETPSRATELLENALKATRNADLSERIAVELIRIRLVYGDFPKAKEAAEKAISISPDEPRRKRLTRMLVPPK